MFTKSYLLNAKIFPKDSKILIKLWSILQSNTEGHSIPVSFDAGDPFLFEPQQQTLDRTYDTCSINKVKIMSFT
jgi:hypothetical protein